MLGPDEWKEFKKGPEYTNVWNFFNNVLLNVKSLPTREDVEKKLNYKFPEGDAGDAEFGKVVNLVLVELLPTRVLCRKILLDGMEVAYQEGLVEELNKLKYFQVEFNTETITIHLDIKLAAYCTYVEKTREEYDR